MILRHGSLIGYLLFLLTAGTNASVSAAPAELPAATAQRIDADVKAVLRRFGVPGAAIMAVRDGQPVYVRTFGLRDTAHSLPVHPDTVFEIGSITKQFTAASILQLEEGGKLKIGRPLSDYLPNAPHAREITLRQLLTLTSGLHDYLDGPEMDRLASHPISYRDLIARIAPLPLDFPPGSRWHYSNTDYLLLGKVIETVSGESYRDYLQRHIFDPLHMKDTHTTAETGHLPNAATGYRHASGRLERAPTIDASWGTSAGFLLTTLSDLAKWDTALSHRKVVSLASYRQMTTPFMTTKNGSANYGFGFFIDSIYSQPRIGHTGGTYGSTAADEYFPRQDIRIVAFTNLGDGTPEAGETLTNIVFAALYPAIAAEAAKSARGENRAITQLVRDAFRELQTGTSYARFNDRLRGKLAAGIGAKFVTGLGPYGVATAQVFKGSRRDAKETWYDYVIQFGPGVSLPFAVKVGQDGAVTGFSVG